MTAIRRAASAALAIGVLAVGVLGFAAPASAHITVEPRTGGVQGAFARIAFFVPNESDSASTTKVEINLPPEHPVPWVSLMPVYGWDAAVEKRQVPPMDLHGMQVTETVTKITWTARPDAAIKPGQFIEFPVSIGPMPKVPRVVFKALQTYSDGNVVRWIEEPPANGGEPPQQPAPVLNLQPAPASPAPAASQPAAAPADDDDDDESESGSTWGIVGLVAGLAGLLLGALALLRSRRPAAAATSGAPAAGPSPGAGGSDA